MSTKKQSAAAATTRQTSKRAQSVGTQDKNAAPAASKRMIISATGKRRMVLESDYQAGRY
jgi:hypothetical protein